MNHRSPRAGVPEPGPAVESDMRTAVWPETHTGFGITTGVTLQGTREARLQQAPLGLISCLGSISSESCDQPTRLIKNRRHHFADQGLSSQSYGFSSSHLWI